MAKKESKKVESPKPAEDRVKALETSISQINKTFGNGTIMYLGQRPDMNIECIHTGSLALDYALGIGGIPKGRIIEIFGPESSGKPRLLCISSLRVRRPEVLQRSLTPNMLWIRSMPRTLALTQTSCLYPSRIPVSRRWRSQMPWCGAGPWMP